MNFRKCLYFIEIKYIYQNLKYYALDWKKAKLNRRGPLPDDL
jgi:hypothetical protein